jgi:DNA-directed RNA polymerase specialized sigma24 family protein
MNDDTIIKQRVSGRSVRAIAKTNGCSVAEVNRVLDLFANATITDQVRKHTLAFELARLDELQRTSYAQALDGDVQSVALVAKIVERRCTMLGLHTPPATTLQVVEAQAPKRTSTQEARAMLDTILHITARERQLLDRRELHGDESQKPWRNARGKPPYGRGVLFGRPRKLTPHQRREAIAGRDAGDETLTDIARSCHVSHSTISRLR